MASAHSCSLECFTLLGLYTPSAAAQAYRTPVIHPFTACARPPRRTTCPVQVSRNPWYRYYFGPLVLVLLAPSPDARPHPNASKPVKVLLVHWFTGLLPPPAPIPVQVLASNPRHADAMHQLGALLVQLYGKDKVRYDTG